MKSKPIKEVSDLQLCKCSCKYITHNPDCRARVQYEAAIARSNVNWNIAAMQKKRTDAAVDKLQLAEKKLAAWGLSDISDKECFDQAQGWRQRACTAEQELKETVSESGANYRNFRRFYALYFTSKGKLEVAEQEIKDLKHDIEKYMDTNRDLLNIDIPALEAKLDAIKSLVQESGYKQDCNCFFCTIKGILYGL